MEITHKYGRYINKQTLTYAFIVSLLIALCVGLSMGMRYWISPSSIRQPGYEHAHFRVQIIVDGDQVDFSAGEFQHSLGDVVACSVELAASPIHFHDGNGQLAHLHWEGMRGGDFLKYYGWNVVGGQDDTLGWRFDTSVVEPLKVVRHGDLLPVIPQGAAFYVYAGDELEYQARSWDEFIHQDLETFFGVESQVSVARQERSSIMGFLFPKAWADQGSSESPGGVDSTAPADLREINNLLGSVVIFVQETEPSPAEIKAKFDTLVPLEDSVCGG